MNNTDKNTISHFFEKTEEIINKDIQQKTPRPQEHLEEKLQNNKPDTLVKKLFRKIALKIQKRLCL